MSKKLYLTEKEKNEILRKYNLVTEQTDEANIKIINKMLGINNSKYSLSHPIAGEMDIVDIDTIKKTFTYMEPTINPFTGPIEKTVPINNFDNIKKQLEMGKDVISLGDSGASLVKKN